MRLKTKLNTKLMIDTLIASVISDFAPGLLNKYLFSSNPLTGTTLQVAGAGAVYVAGALLKKPNVASIGVALAGANLVNKMIVGNDTPTKSVSTGTTYNQPPAKEITYRVDDYVHLSLNDYVNMPTKNIGYSKFYE